jgi:hypothetical protein
LGRPEQKREKNHALKRENQIPTFLLKKMNTMQAKY